MTFDELFAQVLEALQREQRISYRALRRRFELSDDDLEDLKIEIIEAKQLAIDENDRILVWTGDRDSLEVPEPTPISLPVKDPKPPPISYTPKYLREKILTSRSALEGERKQVTVLFADIKDSTELIKDLDPEDAQKLLDPAIHIMMEAVHRFEGTVNQVLGDGIMALLGAPIAHEDHAARACYAALAMQTAMQPYADEVRRSHGIPLQIRVGLNSGEVVVRTIGNDLHMDYSAVGPTTHLAARMEQIATPGSIVLSSGTLRLVEGFVRVTALGPIAIKGMTDPVEVYELTGASTIRRRLQAAVARGLTKFVGRDTEIDALNHARERAGSGHGQVVAAVGEAGVGKSRLVYEFIHSHRTQGWLVLESASVSYGKATPYFPVVDLLKRYVHVEDDDDSRTIRAKVTGQVLTLDESLQETIPALLSLLEALPENSPFLQLDPSQRRHRTLNGLKRILLRESQVQPLLLVFEDLHWIDSETQALLDSLVESLPTAQLLPLVNYRLEYQHSWGSKTFYTQLRLDPLQAESAEAFLTALLGDDPGLEPLKKFLIERTEGNPFFLEESVRTLVETQVLVGESGTYRLAQDLPTIQVPATVQAILAARIDRLPQEEKRLLQTAAVIGNEVSLSLLQAITEVPEESLHRGLTHLQAAEFLYETSLFPERVYTFKHALTHEVTYGSLLQERRRVLHARIVEALEALGGDRLADQVERLAYHAFRGEVWEKALAYYRQAGARAIGRSANREAVTCFEQALSALRQLPKSWERLKQELALQFDLRGTLFPLREFDRSLACLQEAKRLAGELDDRLSLGRILCYQGLHAWMVQKDYVQTLTACQQALEIAQTFQDVPLLALARDNLGRAHFSLGAYTQAMELYAQNIELLTGDLERQRFGMALLLSVSARRLYSRCCAEVGRFAEGQQRTAEAIRLAEAEAHPHSLVMAHSSAGWLALRQGRLPSAIETLEQAVAVCREADIPLLFNILLALLGTAYALTGHLTKALELQERAVAQPDANYALIVALMGETYLLAGRLEEAVQCARQALGRARRQHEQGYEAYDLRLLGDIAMHRDPPESDQAEPYYQQALALANELGMRPLQAHCHRGLGILYRQTEQAEQARTELSTAIDMYRDMEMTFWLPETEAALAEVEHKA